jgi:hypothetical protein
MDQGGQYDPPYSQQNPNPYYRAGNGVLVGNADALLMSDVDIIRFNNGIRFAPVAGVGSSYNVHSITGSSFDSCNYGAYIDGLTGGGFAHGIIFHGCWFGTNAANGVVALQAQGLRIIGCSVINNGSHGIGLYDQCYDALIEGCVIAGNSVGALYTYSGIKIATSTSSGHVINGNRIGATVGQPIRHAYGVSIDAGVRAWIITSNNFYFNQNGPLQDSSSGVNRVYVNNIS